MIRANSEELRYLNKFSNGRGTGFADISEEQGGTGISFRPHDLLEAALATCVNITIRIYAEKHGLPLEEVTTLVNLDRTSMNESVFRYEVKLGGADLTGEQRSKLLEIAKGCAVRRTLSRPIRFESGDGEPASQVAPAQLATAAR